MLGPVRRGAGSLVRAFEEQWPRWVRPTTEDSFANRLLESIDIATGDPRGNGHAERHQRRGNLVDDRNHVRVVGMKAPWNRSPLRSPFDRVPEHPFAPGIN